MRQPAGSMFKRYLASCAKAAWPPVVALALIFAFISKIQFVEYANYIFTKPESGMAHMSGAGVEGMPVLIDDNCFTANGVRIDYIVSNNNPHHYDIDFSYNGSKIGSYQGFDVFMLNFLYGNLIKISIFIIPIMIIGYIMYIMPGVAKKAIQSSEGFVKTIGISAYAACLLLPFVFLQNEFFSSIIHSLSQFQIWR